MSTGYSAAGWHPATTCELSHGLFFFFCQATHDGLMQIDHDGHIPFFFSLCSLRFCFHSSIRKSCGIPPSVFLQSLIFGRGGGALPGIGRTERALPHGWHHEASEITPKFSSQRRLIHPPLDPTVPLDWSSSYLPLTQKRVPRCGGQRFLSRSGADCLSYTIPFLYPISLSLQNERRTNPPTLSMPMSRRARRDQKPIKSRNRDNFGDSETLSSARTPHWRLKDSIFFFSVLLF